MTRVLVTGADGFVGQALVRRLLGQGIGGRAVTTVVSLDLRFSAPAPERVRHVTGSVDDPQVLRAACHDGVDVVFHLASLPGGAAEQDRALGRRINLDATLALLDVLGTQRVPPRLVFASSIAVYGDDLGRRVDESTAPAPALTYGAHKLVSEVLVADASRLGVVQGLSLRLPGIVARPGDGAGLMSAFMSQLFWQVAKGEPITVPVSPGATAWWLSVGACVANLVRAAEVDPALAGPRRVVLVPALHLSVAAVVDALAVRHGAQRAAGVAYEPVPRIERLFGAYPPLATPAAEALGFRHDGSAAQLVENATAH